MQRGMQWMQGVIQHVERGIVMKPFNHTVISFGRRIAAAAILAGALVSPSHALGLEDSITLTSAPGVSGSFVNTYPFMLSVTSGIDYFTSRIDFPPPFSITSFVATLFSGSASLISGVDGSPARALIPNSFFLESLAPGAYQLRISGLASGTSGVDSYSGLLRVTAPIAPNPEPEIWAMMLVGVGLIGMRLRRKSRLDGARHFA